jgi:hypothetical protein
MVTSLKIMKNTWPAAPHKENDKMKSSQFHGGTHARKGTLRKGTKPQPAPYHGGSGAPKGVVHAPQPRTYSVHGGTDLRMGVLNKKRK